MEIHVAPLESALPFEPQALVFEQDADLILRLDRDPVMPRENNEALIGQALAATKHKPGTLVVDESDPIVIMAIVHDLDEQPTWREEWVRTALATLFTYAAEEGISSLAMPLLGTVHGQLDRRRAMELLESAIEEAEVLPDSLWITALADTFDPLPKRWTV